MKEKQDKIIVKGESLICALNVALFFWCTEDKLLFFFYSVLGTRTIYNEGSMTTYVRIIFRFPLGKCILIFLSVHEVIESINCSSKWMTFCAERKTETTTKNKSMSSFLPFLPSSISYLLHLRFKAFILVASHFQPSGKWMWTIWKILKASDCNHWTQRCKKVWEHLFPRLRKLLGYWQKYLPLSHR